MLDAINKPSPFDTLFDMVCHLMHLLENLRQGIEYDFVVLNLHLNLLDVLVDTHPIKDVRLDYLMGEGIGILWHFFA